MADEVYLTFFKWFNSFEDTNLGSAKTVFSGLKISIFKTYVEYREFALESLLFILKNLNCNEIRYNLHQTMLKRNLITLKRKVGNA